MSFGEIPDERAKWEARLRSWRQSRFWLPLWGPKPTEPGCFAPADGARVAGLIASGPSLRRSSSRFPRTGASYRDYSALGNTMPYSWQQPATAVV